VLSRIGITQETLYATEMDSWLLWMR